MEWEDVPGFLLVRELEGNSEEISSQLLPMPVLVVILASSHLEEQHDWFIYLKYGITIVKIHICYLLFITHTE